MAICPIGQNIYLQFLLGFGILLTQMYFPEEHKKSNVERVSGFWLAPAKEKGVRPSVSRSRRPRKNQGPLREGPDPDR